MSGVWEGTSMWAGVWAWGFSKNVGFDTTRLWQITVD
jgi:hypothetical protein